MENFLIDRYGRRHDYLRISVTDRCNLRCQYCMGPEGIKLLEHEKILKYEEILEVVQAAAELGVQKIRLTGGEPLVRKGIEHLIAKIAQVSGIKDLALTTNGVLLKEMAPSLKKAGLKRVNISLDSLRPEVFRTITRCGDLKEVLAGIKAALHYNLSPVKINVVLMKGVNDEEIPDFLRLALEYPLNIRFIEYMPIDDHDQDWQHKYLPLEAVLQKAKDLGYPLVPLEPTEARGPAQLYQIPGGLGSVGLIHPISKHFCPGCNRLRLTADGYLKPCLYWQEELYVRPVIHERGGIKNLLQRALGLKKEQHAMGPEKSLGNDERRGMSQVGG